jgi:DNA-binding transcriptional MocR family regulator
MATWQPHIHAHARVKYIGIADAIEADIKARLIKPGDRLLPQRHIAKLLHVDLSTVTRALNEAAKRGLIDTHAGSGSCIAQTAYQHYSSLLLSEGKTLDLSMNNPPHPTSLNLEQDIADALTTLASHSVTLNQLSYQETAGNPDDRKAAVTWLSPKLHDIDVNQVLIASGAHSALFSILSLLKRQGMTSLAAPDLSYPGLRAIADHLGMDVYGIEMDDNGIIPASLEQAYQKHVFDAIYVIPNIDNPTTVTIPLQRREHIVRFAKQHNITLIEDDPYYAFVDKVITPLYSLLPTQTWHVATVSKCISPALRVAYIVAPSNDAALALAEEIRISSLMAPPLMVAVVSQWINSGHIDVIIADIKCENARRQHLAAAIFSGHDMLTQPSSPHVWLKLSKAHKAIDFTELVGRSGISVVPSTAFVTSRCRTQAVRVSLGVSTDRAALEAGLDIIARLQSASHVRSRSII